MGVDFLFLLRKTINRRRASTIRFILTTDTYYSQVQTSSADNFSQNRCKITKTLPQNKIFYNIFACRKRNNCIITDYGKPLHKTRTAQKQYVLSIL